MQTEEFVQKSKRIFEFVTIGSEKGEMISIRFKNPDNDSKTSFAIPKSSILLDLYLKIEDEVPMIQDLRFYYQEKILTLEEPLKDVLQMAETKDLQVIINGTLIYQTDFDNKAHRKGIELFKAQKYMECIREFSVSLERYPDYYKSMLNRAKAYVKIKQYVPALKDCKKLETLGPQDNREFKKNLIQVRKTAYLHYGRGLLEKGDKESRKLGTEHLKKALLECIYSNLPEETFYEEIANILIQTRSFLDICLVCQKKEKMKKHSQLPTKLIDEFPDYPLEYQFLCESCQKIIDVYENSFVENIWKVYYDDPNRNNEMTFSYRSGDLYWFHIITAWKSIMFFNMKPEKWKQNDYSLKKILETLRQLMRGNKDVNYPNAYFYIGAHDQPYEYINEVIIENNYSFSHVQIGNFHMCTLLSGSSFQFEEASRVHKYSKSFKIYEKSKRTLPSILSNRNFLDSPTDDETKDDRPKKKVKSYYS